MNKFLSGILVVFIILVSCYGLYIYFSRGIHGIKTGELSGIVNMKRPDIIGFRDLKWGMSRQEVKRLQSTPIKDETDSVIMYQEKIDEDNAGVIYMFTPKDELFAAMLVFDIKSENISVFSNKFREKYLILTRKYGNATEYHDNELKKDGLHAVWEFAKTTIMLKLNYAQPYNKLALGLLYANEFYGKQLMNDERLKKY